MLLQKNICIVFIIPEKCECVIDFSYLWGQGFPFHA